MKRSILVASLPHGPQDPVTETTPRAPGSVRRTTVIDQRRSPGPEPRIVLGTGRDLLTRGDGTTAVLAEARLTMAVDLTGVIEAIASEPVVAGLDALVGRPNQPGFRRAVDEALPEQAAGATVLHQLLDDVPMAQLINGYGYSRELGDDFELPTASAEGLADLCAGWERGATMLGAMEEHGIFPIPIGPPAPDVEAGDDPLAWHAHEPLVPRSVRRRRRIDVIAGDPLVVDVHFRDSHLGAEGLEDVLHEYTLRATIDPGSLVVLTAEATARTLPWPECPNAVGSTPWIVGEPLSTLRRTVASAYKGTATCTHLNDVFRSLAGVTSLAGALT